MKKLSGGIQFLGFAILVLFGVATSQSAVAGPHGIFPTKQALEARSSRAAAGTPILYFGGPVISNVKAYAVLWGANVKATTVSQIGDFLSAVVNSTHLDWLSEYNTNIKAVDGRDGTNQRIGRGTYGGKIQITPSITSTKLLDAQIQAEIEKQIEARVLPTPDGNTLYMIYFPPGVSITIDGMSSCQSFCAYHEGFQSAKYGNVFYGIMPDLGGACAFGCGFNPQPFDSLTIVSSHELIEAITDPFPTPGNQPAYPQAWNTADGNEIGDLCAQVKNRLTTQGLTYVLQGEYDKDRGACSSGTFTSP